MKKLHKRKVNLFGKEVSVLLIAMIAVLGLGSAALVPYLSNTITGDVDIGSPITLEITGNTGGSSTANTFTSTIYGGGEFTVSTDTEIHVDGVTGHISETKLSNFDGAGITVYYEDVNGQYAGHVWQIPNCTVEENGVNNTYYYIGDPTETLKKGTSQGKTTFKAALNLDPTQTYSAEARVILANEAKCTPIPTPVTEL